MASLAIALWNTHGVEINLVGAEPARNTELQSKWNGMKSIKGFVNNIDSPKTETQLEVMNNRELKNGGSTQVCQDSRLKTNKEGLKMEIHFENESLNLIRFRGMFLFVLNGWLDIKDEVLELISIDWLNFR